MPAHVQGEAQDASRHDRMGDLARGALERVRMVRTRGYPTADDAALENARSAIGYRAL